MFWPLVPSVAVWTALYGAEGCGRGGYSSGILTQAETNTRLGMRYFKDLMNRFGGANVFERAGESRMTPPASSISSQVRPRISRVPTARRWNNR